VADHDRRQRHAAKIRHSARSGRFHPSSRASFEMDWLRAPGWASRPTCSGIRPPRAHTAPPGIESKARCRTNESSIILAVDCSAFQAAVLWSARRCRRRRPTERSRTGTTLVARRPICVTRMKQRIAVAVERDIPHRLRVAAAFAFHPETSVATGSRSASCQFRSLSAKKLGSSRPSSEHAPSDSSWTMAGINPHC